MNRHFDLIYAICGSQHIFVRAWTLWIWWNTMLDEFINVCRYFIPTEYTLVWIRSWSVDFSYGWRKLKQGIKQRYLYSQTIVARYPFIFSYPTECKKKIKAHYVITGSNNVTQFGEGVTSVQKNIIRFRLVFVHLFNRRSQATKFSRRIKNSECAITDNITGCDIYMILPSASALCIKSWLLGIVHAQHNITQNYYYYYSDWCTMMCLAINSSDVKLLSSPLKY